MRNKYTVSFQGLTKDILFLPLVVDALKKYVKKKIGKVPFSIIKLMWTMSKSSKESDNNMRRR
jgi:hypothetical protein